MKIEIKLRIDERKQLPYWSARAIHEEKILLEVVSQTFDETDPMDMKRRYMNASSRIMKELSDRIQFKQLTQLLIHEN